MKRTQLLTHYDAVVAKSPQPNTGNSQKPSTYDGRRDLRPHERIQLKEQEMTTSQDPWSKPIARAVIRAVKRFNSRRDFATQLANEFVQSSIPGSLWGLLNLATHWSNDLQIWAWQVLMDYDFRNSPSKEECNPPPRFSKKRVKSLTKSDQLMATWRLRKRRIYDFLSKNWPNSYTVEEIARKLKTPHNAIADAIIDLLSPSRWDAEPAVRLALDGKITARRGKKARLAVE